MTEKREGDEPLWTHPLSDSCLRCSLKADSARGANVCASAALGALVGVDAIDVALGDSSNGTFIDASAACYAVFANYISHSK